MNEHISVFYISTLFTAMRQQQQKKKAKRKKKHVNKYEKGSNWFNFKSIFVRPSRCYTKYVLKWKINTKKWIKYCVIKIAAVHIGDLNMMRALFNFCLFSLCHSFSQESPIRCRRWMRTRWRRLWTRKSRPHLVLSRPKSTCPPLTPCTWCHWSVQITVELSISACHLVDPLEIYSHCMNGAHQMTVMSLNCPLRCRKQSEALCVGDTLSPSLALCVSPSLSLCVLLWKAARIKCGKWKQNTKDKTKLISHCVTLATTTDNLYTSIISMGFFEHLLHNLVLSHKMLQNSLWFAVRFFVFLLFLSSHLIKVVENGCFFWCIVLYLNCTHICVHKLCERIGVD